MPQTRRDFLAFAARSALLGLGLGANFPLGNLWAGSGAPGMPLPIPGQSGLFGLLRVEDKLTFRATSVPKLLPARAAHMLAYATTDQGRQYYNPVLVLNKGQHFELDLDNALQEPTIIHWHGVDTPWQQAGHPTYAINPGQRYRYAFDITNRAGTYWYHPHPHMLTAKQAYLGLASFFIVRDPEELAFAQDMDLVLGETDIPIVIQDRKFTPAGGLSYAPTRDELLMGYLGDHILANGAENATLDVGTRAYRFRLLNGSNARISNLAFLAGSSRLPFHLIGNDGGFLPAPHQTDSVFLAPGERLDIILDLSAIPIGTEIVLSNVPFDPMHHEMTTMDDMSGMNGMMHMSGPHGMDHTAGHQQAGHQSAEQQHAGHNAGLPEGASFPILRLKVVTRIAYARKLPQELGSLPPMPAAAGPQRTFELAMQHMGGWTINGLTFKMDETPIVVPQRQRETWIIANASASMPHPMHLHGYFYRVRERRNSPAQIRAAALDPSGRIPTDLGYKDTVVVWPGESIVLDIDFSTPNYPGPQTFLLHCHNLEHEDQGMMLNVRVE